MRPLDDEVVGEEETSRLSLLCLLFGVGTDILAASYFKKRCEESKHFRRLFDGWAFCIFQFPKISDQLQKRKKEKGLLQTLQIGSPTIEVNPQRHALG